jgi:LacI family transcriptional regulator
MSGRTTIKDIAKDTGLSVTTVSLVLNGKAFKIPEATKRKITLSAERLNYRPNQLAVGLVKKHTNTIGLIISDISNLFFASLAKSVEETAHAEGSNLILCNSGDKHQGDIDYINILADKGVDGIVYGMAIDTTLEKAEKSKALMDSYKIPFVMVDRYFNELHAPCLRVDHVSGGYHATKYLLREGHSRIACITGPKYLSDSNERLAGYRTALRESGIEYDPDLIYEGSYSWESGIEAMKWLTGKNFSAVFAFNDMMAFGVYNQAKKSGYKIPADFSLVGYDDIFFSRMLETPLTTVRQPISELGKRSALLLLDLIHGHYGKNPSGILEPELIIRKSSGPAKKKGI